MKGRKTRYLDSPTGRKVYLLANMGDGYAHIEVPTKRGPVTFETPASRLHKPLN